jgi:hypothetical protein
MVWPVTRSCNAHQSFVKLSVATLSEQQVAKTDGRMPFLAIWVLEQTQQGMP